MSGSGLTIGKLAARAGVGVETVRYYQRQGLLELPDRSGSGFREYSERDQWRLAFIRRAKDLGFTLAEISELLGPAQAGSAADIARAADAKLAAVAGQIAGLLELQHRLRRLLLICERGDSGDCAALDLGEPACSESARPPAPLTRLLNLPAEGQPA